MASREPSEAPVPCTYGDIGELALSFLVARVAFSIFPRAQIDHILCRNGMPSTGTGRVRTCMRFVSERGQKRGRLNGEYCSRRAATYANWAINSFATSSSPPILAPCYGLDLFGARNRRNGHCHSDSPTPRSHTNGEQWSNFHTKERVRS